MSGSGDYYWKKGQKKKKEEKIEVQIRKKGRSIYRKKNRGKINFTVYPANGGSRTLWIAVLGLGSSSTYMHHVLLVIFIYTGRGKYTRESRAVEPEC